MVNMINGNNDNICIYSGDSLKKTKIKFKPIEYFNNLSNVLLLIIIACSITPISSMMVKKNPIEKTEYIRIDNESSCLNSSIKVEMDIKTSLVGVWKILKYGACKDTYLIKYAELYRPVVEFQKEGKEWLLNWISIDYKGQFGFKFKLNKKFEEKIVGENTEAVVKIENNKLYKIHKSIKKNNEKLRWTFEVPQEDTMIITLYLRNITIVDTFKRIIVDHLPERCRVE